MRTHADIIKDAGGPHAIAAKLEAHDHAPLATLQSRVRAWSLKDGSIPGEYWALLEQLEIATIRELAEAAHSRRLCRRPPDPVPTAA